MGEVFRGTDQQGQGLAFKVLHPDLAGDANVVSRFVQERSILLSVSSPNLVRVVDLVVEGETLAIAMELVRGQDLRAYLTASGTLAPAQICQIGAGIAYGLAAVHEAGIVHRDIKPENVLLDAADGPLVPKVTDFGVSSLVDTERARSTMLVGTPQYIAPEVSEGGAVTAASDLYALGVVLYELACGITPFAGGSVMAVLRRHSSVTPGRPGSVPDALWDLISWLLAKNPGQRPPTARQVGTILEALAPSLAAYPPAPKLTEPPVAHEAVETQLTQAVPFTMGTGRTENVTEDPPAGPADPPTPVIPPTPPATTVPSAAAAPAAGTDTPKTKRKGPLVAVLAVGIVAVLAAGTVVALNIFGGSKPDESAGKSGTSIESVTPAASPASPASPAATAIDVAMNDAASPEATPTYAPGDAVPDVVGKLLPDAQKVLGDAVTVGVVDKFDTTKPDGTVLSQSPEAGADPASAVELTVARSAVVAYLDGESAVAGDWNSKSAVKISGVTYAHSVSDNICSYEDSRVVEYNLGRNYESLTASAGIADESADSSAVVLVEVFADGRKVYSQSMVYGKPFPINVDMSDVLRMKIQWQTTTCSQDHAGSKLALGEAKLLGRPGKVPAESPAP